jgi:hypothetical protein
LPLISVISLASCRNTASGNFKIGIIAMDIITSIGYLHVLFNFTAELEIFQELPGRNRQNCCQGRGETG